MTFENASEVVMQGVLLKKSRSWLEPYVARQFVLYSDNQLQYYSTSSGKCKGVVPMAQCEISELFVSKHNRQLIYCVRITNNMSEEDMNDEGSLDEVMSQLSSSGIETTTNTPKKGGGPPMNESSMTSLKQRRSQDSHNRVPSTVEVESSTPTRSNSHRTMLNESNTEEETLVRDYKHSKKIKSKQSKKKFLQTTQMAVAAGATAGLAVATAGVGLVAGLVFVGAAAAGGGSAGYGSQGTNPQKKEVLVAHYSYEAIQSWRNCLLAAQESQTVEQSTWGQLFASDGRKTRNALLPQQRNQPRSTMTASTTNPYPTITTGAGLSPRSRLPERFLEGYATVWRPLVGGWATSLPGVGALRIFREERQEIPHGRYVNRSVDGKNCSPIKSHIVLGTAAVDAFLCLMSFGCVGSFDYGQLVLLNHGWEQIQSFRIVEPIDDHTDIIHMVMAPLFLFPSHTSPRDFCLYRHWRLESDGSYVICYDSVEHSYCLPKPDIVRAEMHQVITIAPLKPTRRGKQPARGGPAPPKGGECLMSAVVQINPRGWVPTTPLPLLSNQSYGEAFGVAVLSQLLEIRDAIDMDRFVPTLTDEPEHSSHHLSSSSHGIVQVRSSESGEEEDEEEEGMNYDFSFANPRQLNADDTILTGLGSIPPPLNMESWAEPDSNSFKVRGKSYKQDGIKNNAGKSIARLIAVDVVSVSAPLYSGFSIHPTERIQRALAKEAELLAQGKESDMPPFVFVVNIVVPGPPFYHGVFYYAIDDVSTINGKDGSPSSILCSQFFFGESDEFRDKTFKLIPQIVQGNFMVRKAVGSTPAIMGKKLRQLYVRNERFFEVILDCASSSVATGVIRLALGYAKTLVVDMGFLFEGNDETTLPERIFGCARLKNPDFGPHMRHVVAPEELEGNDEL